MKKLLFTLFLFSVVSIHTYGQKLYVVGNFKDMNMESPSEVGEMKQVEGTDVWKLAIRLPKGKHKFQLMTDAGRKSRHGEREIRLKKEDLVVFYAKSTDRFVCSAEPLYVVGSAVGDWSMQSLKPMEMRSDRATYTDRFDKANFQVVKVVGNEIIWNETNEKKEMQHKGEYTITFDFTTFEVTVD